MSGKIILVRHGEPDVKIADKISGNEIAHFLDSYNEANIKIISLPPLDLKSLVHDCVIVCSDLNRSLSSASACGLTPSIIDSVFCESIPPHFQNDWMKFSPKQWLVMSRLLWMIGFSKNGESLKETKQRANKAVDILVSSSLEEDVVLFGHGLFNIMIAKELKSRGYKGPRIPAKKYWEYGIYTLQITS